MSTCVHDLRGGFRVSHIPDHTAIPHKSRCAEDCISGKEFVVLGSFVQPYSYKNFWESCQWQEKVKDKGAQAVRGILFATADTTTVHNHNATSTIPIDRR